MKKSLIALAVLAASGASFAQVTVTGILVAGYQATTDGQAGSAASKESAGFGTETAKIWFNAKEDLGGGYSASAQMGIRTGATGASGSTTTAFGGSITSVASTGGTTTEDTKLVLVTPFGGFAAGTVLGADYLSEGIAGVGAYYAGSASTGWASKVLTARSNRDFIAYTVPVGALTFAIGQQDKANTTGVGGGTTGTDADSGPFAGSNSPLTFLSATYAAGPLEANAMYLAYKNNAAVGNNKDTTRLSAAYDLGMAKIGAGLQISNVQGFSTNPNPKVTDLLVAATVPMGASSFGITYTSRQYADYAATAAAASITAANDTATGYSLQYGYAMSKRTSVIANYARWTQASAYLAPSANANTQYQLLLAHSF